MKAAVLRTIPSALEIDEVRIDGPGPREVMIRTAAAGLCQSDLHTMATVELHGVDLLHEKKLQGSNMGSGSFRLDMPTYAA